MNKEKCEIAYADLEVCREVMRESIERNGEIINPVSSFDKAMVIFARLIEDHFDNPPLKFEQLEVGMWVWDNKRKEWCVLAAFWKDALNRYYVSGISDSPFEENRFYRKQVE